MSAAQRYATLDGLRGVAAGLVVCYHTHLFRGSAAITPHGYLAVDFFFMLSGFVIASAYQEKLEAGFTVADFVTQRVIRLYPVALAGILLGALRLVSLYVIRSGRLGARAMDRVGPLAQRCYPACREPDTLSRRTVSHQRSHVVAVWRIIGQPWMVNFRCAQIVDHRHRVSNDRFRHRSVLHDA